MASEHTSSQAPSLTVPQEEAASASISELQECLGTILLSEKAQDEYVPIYERPGSQVIECKWSGSFMLFSFPRELRDRIYYHYLDSPIPAAYHKEVRRIFPFDQPDEITTLFLTCKQVYAEAYPLFCRTRQIHLDTYPIKLHKELNSHSITSTFPSKPAALITRLTMQYLSYGRYSYFPPVRNPREKKGVDRVFIRMIKDADLLKSIFPRLRQFTATFGYGPWDFDQAGLRIDDSMAEDIKTALVLEWMRKVMQEYAVIVPAKWLRFAFYSRWSENGMIPHKRAFNDAYVQLLRETAAFRDEDVVMKECVKKWLDGTRFGAETE